MNVALYARVSTEEQARHGISIDAQIDVLRKWADEHGHTVVGEYIDPGISARKPPSKRPSLQQLLSDIPEKKIDLILFTKLDRWTRNVKGYYQVQDILDEHHVAWNAILERYETESVNGRFTMNVLLAVSEQEADRTAERIKAVLAHKVEMGEAITRALPIGLKIEGKKVVPDEHEEAARAVFAEFIKTANTQHTRDYLQDRYGISLPLLSIRNMLRNELYIGKYRGNESYCQPIISAEDFAEAGRLLDSRGVKRTPTRQVYLFSGLVFCGSCNHRMAGTHTKVLSYRCNMHYELKRCAHAGYYNEAKLEEYILAHIGDLAAEQSMRVVEQKPKPPAIDKAAIRRKLDRLKDLYIEGDMEIEKYRAERDRLAALLDTPEAPKPRALEILGDDFQKDYADMSREQKQRLWRSVIDRIVIDADRKISIFLR